MKASIFGALLAVTLLAAASGCGARPAEGAAQIVYSVGLAQGSEHAGLFVTDEEGRRHRRLTRAPGPTAIAARWSPAGDRILFEVQTYAGGEIWTMNPDGTGARNIADGLSASWSPAGREVAVVGGKGFISILSADGSPRAEIDLGLERDEFVDLAPDWSRNGAELALSVSPLNISASLIVTVRADGKGRPRSLGLARDGVLEEHPKWSPDGRLIAFHRSDESDGTSVWLMRADGSSRRLIARDVGPPAWSLDGKSLLCEVTAPGAEGVFVYPLDGGEPQRLGPARSGLHESRGRFRHRLGRDVSWQPEGKLVAYVDDAGKVIVSGPDGSERRQLTDPGEDAMPDWSPDGSQIAFARGSEGDAEVYVIGADGKGERRIAEGSGPQWSPDGAALLIGVTRGKQAGFSVVTQDPFRIGPMTGGRSAAWSPDGTSIAFVRDELDSGESQMVTQSTLHTMRPDGTGLRTIGRSEPGAHFAFADPVWAPDGESILIDEADPLVGSDARLRRIRIDGSVRETIARGGDDISSFAQLTVSPDGRQAAFVFDGGSDVETIDLTGRKLTEVLSGDSFISGLSWSPDGERLAYVVSRGEEAFDLYVMNADGTNRRRISKPMGPVGDFDWRRS